MLIGGDSAGGSYAGKALCTPENALLEPHCRLFARSGLLSLASLLSSSFLHDRAAASALLWRVRVVLLVDGAPDRGDHEVLCAIRVGDDAAARVSISLSSLSASGRGYISPVGGL